MCPKYILGIPQGPSGMVPGARPGLLLPDLDGRNKSIAHRPRHYIRRADRLRYADRQVAPSGAIDPLRTSPEIIPGLLVCMSCMLELPPQVGVLGGILPSAPAATPSGGGIPLGTSAPGS
jgi:hypothetical protein